MRIAFKLAYFGNNFHGSQYQPNVRTVEGELREALNRLQIRCTPRFAGRTDAGVHALGQVFALDCEHLLMPRVLDSELPKDIVAWAYAEVSDDFNPRKAKSRVYRYVMLDEGYDLDRMQKAAEMLVGTHNFANFTRGGKEALRTVFSSKIEKIGDFLIFEVEANAFTWNMVRCIVTALKLVGREKDLEWFRSLLEADIKQRVKASEPDGLILWDVRYDGVNFKPDEVALKLLKRRILEKLRIHAMLYKVLALQHEFLSKNYPFDSGKENND